MKPPPEPTRVIYKRRRCDRCGKRTSRPTICFACEKGET